MTSSNRTQRYRQRRLCVATSRQLIVHLQLWMGTHPSGPSVIVGDGVDEEFNNKPLLDVLQMCPEYVGCVNTVKKFGDDLPFLFKVLSVREPLSIQTHPDKTLAERLHAQEPTRYPDPNHKPEMAIAITEFCALCSFRTHEDIAQNFRLVPELVELVGKTAANEFMAATDDQAKVDALRLCFANLMNANPVDVAKHLQSVNTRFNSCSDQSDKMRMLIRAFNKLFKFYPTDVGCFCLFFLNYLELKPGEALFLAANEPHAYISGGKSCQRLCFHRALQNALSALSDCVECMAKSDNVIRAGLTPKFKDVPQLCASLTYSFKSADEIIFHALEVDAFTSRYLTPINEFAVDAFRVTAATAKPQLFLPALHSGSILLVLEGRFAVADRTVTAGQVFFVPAMISLPIKFAGVDVLCYRAYMP